MVDTLIDYIEYGVPIGYEGKRESLENPNWASVGKFKEATLKNFKDDVDRGRMMGPFSSPPLPNFVVSPLGAFQRKRSGKVRIIHDLSWPPGRSVNDGIDPDQCSLQYMTVDDVARACDSYRPGIAHMAKLDLKDAFKHIVVRPSDWHLLGSVWDPAQFGLEGEKEYYFSTVLEFGCRSSPKLFDMFADALNYIMTKRGASPDTQHYMDDYITVENGGKRCDASLDVMLETCDSAGVDVQQTKVFRSFTCGDFLGIEVDSVKREFRLSEEKLAEIYHELQKWYNTKRCTKRELLSLIGKLIFASRVVRAGRTFVSRLIDLSKKVKYLHYKINMSKSARADIEWWLQCIHSHNGVASFPGEWVTSETLNMFTDASDSGVGAVCGHEWFSIAFIESLRWLKSFPICWRELYALVKAIATWGETLRGKRVTLYIDNQTVVYCINKGASRETNLMSLIRTLYLLLAKYDIECKAEYISTVENSSADALSRLDIRSFQRLNPEAWPYMTWPSPIKFEGKTI